MLYLDDRDIDSLGTDWPELVNSLRAALVAVRAGDFAQPVKPYLRYKDPTNRIIAMPAYLGGSSNLAGLKWIASFPGNLQRGLPRAHSVTVLNEADTGVPLAVLRSARISGVRTAAVTALMLQSAFPMKSGPLRFGMTGYGPIGQLHLRMMFELFGERIESFRIYDLRGVDAKAIPAAWKARVQAVDRWQDAFVDSDVFVTCTASSQRYIDLRAPSGSLQLNVSLRDYVTGFRKYAQHIVVDDWEEVCRENTDIHAMQREQGLSSGETLSLADVVAGALEKRQPADVVMFNPMGMAIFDIAIGGYYMRLARQREVGRDLARPE